MVRTRHGFAWAAAKWLAVWAIVGSTGLAWALDFPGPAPGKAVARLEQDSLILENAAISFTWSTAAGRLSPQKVVDKLSSAAIEFKAGDCFRVLVDQSPLPRARVYGAADLHVVGKPEVVDLTPNAAAHRRAQQLAGKALVVNLAANDGLQVQWRAILRDGSNYVRQTLRLSVKSRPVALKEVVLFDATAPRATVLGSVDGSPVVAGNWFFACEHPTSKSQLLDAAGNVVAPDAGAAAGAQRFSCSLGCNRGLTPGHAIECSSVVGVTPAGQLRRGFLYYLERERAHPYRPLLHYNNGSEIGCRYWALALKGPAGEAQKFRLRQETIWIEAIQAFGRELVEKRKVRVDSFAHDFAWDDENLVWQFHDGYPQGFTPARQAAEKYGSHLGVWFSPAGGYPGKAARLKSGALQGLEISRYGLNLGGPRYYARFREACVNMVRQYGVNYFKFDGFGAGNNQPGAGAYASDVEGLLRVIQELRGLDPDVYINPSTGSWPSPFWLLYADSIWRQGADTNVVGKGSMRQKWISYRDGQIRHGTLERGPLYPVNSLMIHGIFVNRLPLFGNPYDPKATRPTYDPAEITAEIRSFFGTGTSLQEMYIHPELMTPETWDVLAEAAHWSRENADVLVDTHALGGDPDKSEVYGWASWAPRKGILVLRNPDDQPAQITLDVGRALELPAGAATKYVLKSPWKSDAAQASIRLTAGVQHTFALKPFEVLMFDATPAEK